MDVGRGFEDIGGFADDRIEGRIEFGIGHVHNRDIGTEDFGQVAAGGTAVAGGFNFGHDGYAALVGISDHFLPLRHAVDLRHWAAAGGGIGLAQLRISGGGKSPRMVVGHMQLEETQAVVAHHVHHASEFFHRVLLAGEIDHAAVILRVGLVLNGDLRDAEPSLVAGDGLEQQAGAMGRSDVAAARDGDPVGDG